jgi:hypothetical protein
MTPDNVFKFVNVRPVQLVSESTSPRYAKYGSAKSPLHEKLSKNTEETASEQALKDAEQFFKETKRPEGLSELLSAASRIVGKQEEADEAREDLEKLVGQKLLDWLKSEKAKAYKNFVWDSVYAHVVAPAVNPQGRQTAYADARLLSYVEALAKVADKDDKTRTKDLMPVGLVIPPDLLRRAGKRPLAESRAGALKGVAVKASQVADEIEALSKAAHELREREREYRYAARTVVSLVEPEVGQLKEMKQLPVGGASALAESAKVPKEFDTGGTVTAVVPKPRAVHQDDKAKALFSEPTMKLLTERRASLASLSARQSAEELESEAYRLADEFLRTVPLDAVGTLIKEGSIAKIATLARLPFAPSFSLPTPLPEEPTPELRGLRPLGMGDLLVVKQKLLRYETGEIAHIENVLKSEKKERVHKRLREIEETVVREIEELEESEKSLQSTERFELHKEAEKTIESQTKFDAGVSVTASYGVVSVNAHADFALTNSVQESAKTASTYAKEVTEKSVSRIQQRTREERTRRTLERFEEVNQHSCDNSKGDDHVIGVYKWLDKYYRARVVNYGRRLMFEFIVPEPASFYLHVTQNRPVTGVTMQKPEPPRYGGQPLSPTHLTRNNYVTYLATYNVQGVDAYPEAQVVVSAGLVAKKADGSGGNIPLAEASEKLVIPNGYEAYGIYGTWSLSGWDGRFISVSVAGTPWANLFVNGVEKIVPITVNAWGNAFYVNLSALCEPTDAEIEKWRLKTFEAIINAYNAALSAYNEQLAAARIQQGVEIEGRNPANNRRIEREELRKSAIRLLTDEFAYLRVNGQTLYNYRFHAMGDSGQYGFPEFDTGTAMLEGRIIQFFEQAFEWNNIVYRFYPYFWARKDRWDDRLPLNDPDPQFAEFLRSGAVRMIVPVQPSYAEAVLYYLHTGEIWNGGEPPTIDDPLYVSIVEELRSDATVNDDAESLSVCGVDPTTPCIVDEWEVKVPTDLVYLQKGIDLNT